MNQARQIAEHSLAISLGGVRLVTQYRIGLSHSFRVPAASGYFGVCSCPTQTDLRTCTHSRRQAARDGTRPPPERFRSVSATRRTKMLFLRRLLMHYGIYRRYPLGRLPALRNAWRTAQA
jgi:hypothetical protein